MRHDADEHIIKMWYVAIIRPRMLISICWAYFYALSCLNQEQAVLSEDREIRSSVSRFFRFPSLTHGHYLGYILLFIANEDVTVHPARLFDRSVANSALSNSGRRTFAHTNVVIMHVRREKIELKI